MDISNDENLLVGFETNDDAAVYRVAPDIALISTVDYITPPVDDPYWFGQIAAAALTALRGSDGSATKRRVILAWLAVATALLAAFMIVWLDQPAVDPNDPYAGY